MEGVRELPALGARPEPLPVEDHRDKPGLGRHGRVDCEPHRHRDLVFESRCLFLFFWSLVFVFWGRLGFSLSPPPSRPPSLDPPPPHPVARSLALAQISPAFEVTAESTVNHTDTAT